MDLDDLFAELDNAILLLHNDPVQPINIDPRTLFGITPIRFEGTTAVFSSQDIDDWGPPQDFGYTDFIVVEDRETSSPMVMDYDMEVERRRRPIHWYSRLERFVGIAKSLLGHKCIPFEITEMMKDVEATWEGVRKKLKEQKLRRHYNSIPGILWNMGMKVPQIDSLTFLSLVSDFMRLNESFDRNKGERKYFPNLRFIALKLFDMHGIFFDYFIPKVRTERKRESLEEFWNKIY